MKMDLWSPLLSNMAMHFVMYCRDRGMAGSGVPEQRAICVTVLARMCECLSDYSCRTFEIG